MPVRSPSRGCEMMARIGESGEKCACAERGAPSRSERKQGPEGGRGKGASSLRIEDRGVSVRGTREAASALWPLLSSAEPIFAFSVPHPHLRCCLGTPKPHGAPKSKDALFIFHFSSPRSGFSFFLKSHFLLQPRGRVPSASCPLSDLTSSPVTTPWGRHPRAVGLGPAG